MRKRVQAILIFCKRGPEDQFRSRTRSLTGRVSCAIRSMVVS